MAVEIGESLERAITALSPVPVRDQFGGRVFLGYDRTDVRWKESAWRRVILGTMGARFTPDPFGGFSIEVPDPERLLACATTNAVPVELTTSTRDADEAMIPDVYGAVVLGRRHPVETATHGSYMRSALSPNLGITPVVLFGDGLFDLYDGRTANAAQLADVHREVTARIGAAVMELFEGNVKGFRHFIDVAVPNALNRYSTEQPAHNSTASVAVRTMLMAGFDRFGIDAPDLPPVLSRAKGVSV